MSILKTKLFSILDINESVLHTEAPKGYVRTEPATITKCWILPGHVKTAILRRNRRAFSIYMLRSCSTNKKRKLHANLPVMGTEAFWGMVCRQQPTTPPTSVGTLLFPWWGGVSFLPLQSGWTCCFDQQNPVEVTLCLFYSRPRTSEALWLLVLVLLKVWPRLLNDERAGGERGQVEEDQGVPATGGTKVPDMWNKAILDLPAALKPLQQILYRTQVSPPHSSGTQSCEQKNYCYFMSLGLQMICYKVITERHILWFPPPSGSKEATCLGFYTLSLCCLPILIPGPLSILFQGTNYTSYIKCP